MKRVALMFLSIFIVFGMYALDTDFTVTVTNIKESKGQIVIGVFDRQSSFPKEGKQVRKIVIPVTGNQVSKTIDLPNGTYGLAIFHDENGDGKCDQNMLGIPKEGFAFSNNFKPSVKAPKFKDVQFTINDNMNMKIKLLHF